MEATDRGEAIRALGERLAAIGLDEKDAVLYVHLCVNGPSKASEVATAAKLNRTEAYRSLDNLIRRGFVTASLERPTLYEATPPEKVFDDALAAHVARRSVIERARESTVAALNQLRTLDTAGPLKTSYKMLQGRPAILSAGESLIRRARQSVWGASTYLAPGNATDANPMYVAFLERGAEGIPIRALIRETPGMTQRLADALVQPRVHARYFDAPASLRLVIVDGCEVIIWLASDPSPHLAARDDVAMWTNAPDFVNAQKLLFDLAWARGHDVPRAKRRLEDESQRL